MIRRLLPFAATAAVVAAAAIVALGTAPASAAQPAHQYLALGDSLADGVQKGGIVHKGYAEKIAHRRGLTLTNLACAGGESTASFLDGSICAYAEGSQLKAAVSWLKAHHGKVALITLDIGADDFGPCLTSAMPMLCVAAKIAQVDANLPVILGALRKAAPGVPLIAHNYYSPYRSSLITGLTGKFNQDELVHYSRFEVPVADIFGAFGSRVCSLTTACDTPPDIHPTDAGYDVMSKALLPLIPKA